MQNALAPWEQLPMYAVSDELAPTIAKLGLEQNLDELRENGYTIISVDRDADRPAPSRDPASGRGRARSELELRPRLRDAARRGSGVRGGVHASRRLGAGRVHLRPRLHA